MNLRTRILLGTLLILAAALSGCSHYDGPPLTVSGSWTTASGGTIGGSIHLDPSFAREKK